MNGHQKQREQSGRMIEDALFELMNKKSYSQITVSEIVKKADVSRRTFYRLYQEKDEILRRYFHGLCQEYCESTPELDHYNIEQIAREYFSFWYQHKNFLLLMHRAGMDTMLYHELCCTSINVIKSRIKKQNIRGLEYFADYSAGGFILLLQHWIVNGMQELPEQYAKTVSEALLQFIRPV